jgi:predicted Zn-dependent peptidase
LTYGKVVTPESVYDRLAKVTSAEIQQVARKILTMRTLSLAMVGSGPSKEEILDLVEKGG